jgi:periplasmic protein TonB
MSAIPYAQSVTPGDRLGLTLFLAAAIHGIVILGVGFGIHLGSGERQPPMIDVVLVQTESPTPPEETERIAQADQQASGQAEEPDRPSAPITAPLPLPTHGQAQEQATPTAPEPAPAETSRCSRGSRPIGRYPCRSRSSRRRGASCPAPTGSWNAAWRWPA